MKIFSLVLMLFVAVSVFSVAVMMPPQPADYNTKNNAYYQVFFDERGQASVFARFDVFNSQSNSLNSISITIPGSSVELKYAMYAKMPDSQRNYQGYGYNLNYSFAKVEKIAENAYTIRLNEPLNQGETISILAYYKAFGYVSNGLVTQDFAFETPKLPYDVEYTRVGISVDENLFLKDSGATSIYKQTFATMESAQIAQNKMMAGSRVMDDIRGYGQYSKTKNNLNAGETLKVMGSYSDSWWKLHILEIVGGIVVLAVVIYAIKKYVYPKIRKVFDGLLSTTAARGGKNVKKNEGFNASRALAVGFVSSVVFSVVAALVFWIMILATKSGMMGNDAGILFIYILGMVLLGLVAAVMVGLSVANRFGITEGIVASVVFVGISLILVPILVIVSAILMALIDSMGNRTVQVMNY